MSTAEIIQLARQAVSGSFLGLLLYGSYARHDYDESSDIDLLQITSSHTAPYSVGKINITCYTPGQLFGLARSGSLFAKHLVTEAVPIDDPDRFLNRLKAAFAEPASYIPLYMEIHGALPIVAICESEFGQNVRHYSATASYLLRSFVYAKSAESGSTSFSMRNVGVILGDQRPYERLRALKDTPTYFHFQQVVDLLFEFSGAYPFCRLESLEAFVVNSYGILDLAVVLGLRVLAQGSLLTYVFINTRTL